MKTKSQGKWRSWRNLAVTEAETRVMIGFLGIEKSCDWLNF